MPYSKDRRYLDKYHAANERKKAWLTVRLSKPMFMALEHYCNRNRVNKSVLIHDYLYSLLGNDLIQEFKEDRVIDADILGLLDIEEGQPAGQINEESPAATSDEDNLIDAFL